MSWEKKPSLVIYDELRGLQRSVIALGPQQEICAAHVLVQRLNQNEPAQLGKISRQMAEAAVNIEVLYSDHDHQLILVAE